MKHIFSIVLALGLSLSSIAFAAVKTEIIEYKQGDTVLEGILAYNTARKSGPSPTVIIVHDWMGVGEYAKSRAEQLAKMGYTAFAADIYGKGVRPKDSKEAGELAGKYKADRALLRQRIQAAVDWAKTNPHVMKNKIVAIGYCFGGTTVLELARSGSDVRGVVSIHGGLDTPNSDDMKNYKGKILVLHGGADPFVPPDQVAAFMNEVNKAGTKWDMITYGGAVHAFSVPGAGNDPSKGAAYNKDADTKSFAAMKSFFENIF